MQYFDRIAEEVEDDGEVMLIWDINKDKMNLSFTASQCSVKAKIPPSVNTIYSMPYLDPNSVNCNCRSLRSRKKFCTTVVFQLQSLSLSHINEKTA